MSTIPVQAQMTLEQLISAVKQLSREDLREFERQFAEWQRQSANGTKRRSNGKQAETDAKLIEGTKSDLPAKDRRRLKQLSEKSELGVLTPKELVEYRKLAQRSEGIDVARVEALAELARRRGKSLEEMMKEIGWRSGNDET
ncbi:MAG: hypothetical protein ACREBD_15050 [Blastocatellia bacterium]